MSSEREWAIKLGQLARKNNQVVGENSDYYVTLEQVDSLAMLPATPSEPEPFTTASMLKHTRERQQESQRLHDELVKALAEEHLHVDTREMDIIVKVAGRAATPSEPHQVALNPDFECCDCYYDTSGDEPVLVTKDCSHHNRAATPSEGARDLAKSICGYYTLSDQEDFLTCRIAAYGDARAAEERDDERQACWEDFMVLLRNCITDAPHSAALKSLRSAVFEQGWKELGTGDGKPQHKRPNSFVEQWRNEL